MDFPSVKPLELDKVAASYDYEAETWFEFERDIWDRIERYGDGFGHTIVQHLNRTSQRLHAFLDYLGYESRVAINIGHAFRLHDAGKILQAPSLWGLDEKPDANVRLLRKQHVDLGPEVLAQTLERHPMLKGHAHLGVLECLMRHHHERINGAGPHKLAGHDLGAIVEAAGIVDTVDGKAIERQKAPDGNPTSNLLKVETRIAEALREMTALPAYTSRPEKHHGEFRPELLDQAIQFYQRDMDVWILPAPAAGG